MSKNSTRNVLIETLRDCWDALLLTASVWMLYNVASQYPAPLALSDVGVLFFAIFTARAALKSW